MKKTILLLIIFLLLFATTAFAQEMNLPKPGLTPDSSFYFLDTLGERIGMFFTFGAEKKAEKAFQYAGEKLAEVKVMAGANKIESLKKAGQKYQEYLSLFFKKGGKASKEGKDVKELERISKLRSIDYLRVLADTHEEALEEAKAEVEKIINVSRKFFGETIWGLHEEKMKELREEKIREELKKEIKEEIKIEPSFQPYADKIITITGKFYSDDEWQYVQTKDGSIYTIQTHPVLVYVANLSNIKKEDRVESMEGLRDLIEGRVNVIGVEKILVQVIEENKIVVEPMITPLKIKENFIDELLKLIGKTPYLEFLLEGKSTELTGKHLMRAQLDSDPKTNKPMISLKFDKEGGQIFEELFSKNIGKQLAIYLDGISIYSFIIQSSTPTITGDFTIDEAKQLVRFLNAGAMPVPMTLVSHQNKIDMEELRGLQGKTISVKGYLIGKNLIDIISFETE